MTTCISHQIARVPFGAWKTLTFVAGLRCDGMTAPMMINGAMNGETFSAYVEQCLVPTLKRGDIVVMDNVAIHRVAGVREAVEAADATRECQEFRVRAGIMGEKESQYVSTQRTCDPE